MDPKGKGMVVNDKEKEAIFNEPRGDKPTDSGSSHKKKDGKKKRRIKKIVYYNNDESSSSPRDDDDEKMSHPVLRNKAGCISYMRQRRQHI
jgi:DNA modification methylase